MSEEKRLNVDPSWSGVYRASGLSLFAGGAIIVVFLLSVFIMQVPLPDTPQVFLENPMPPVILYGLAAFGEFLLMPGVLGLYLSLKDVKKTHMLIGTAVWLAAIPMFLVSRGQINSLLPIAASYTATTNEIMKAAYVASVELAIAAANVYVAMALALLGVGSIMIGLVMLKGVFGKGTGYLVIVAGILILLGTCGALVEVLAQLTLFGLVLTAACKQLLAPDSTDLAKARWNHGGCDEGNGLSRLWFTRQP
ncbi:hypothetical protein ACFLT5_00320 [Chloroflexota bacterium]